MSAADKATEVITEATADAAAEVAKQAEAVEQFVRSLNKIKLQFGLLGVAIGAVAGATTAFYIGYRQAETKYGKIADDEIAVMRQHYRNRAKALEGTAQKSDLESLVTEKGYSTPPMAVQPPDAVIESEDEIAGEPPDEAEMGADETTPDVEKFVSTTRNVFREAEVNDKWDYQEELKQRSPDIPYVIHYDERHELEDYDEVTLTYYEGDDVLCNDRDEIVDPDRRNELVGERNLNLFGHGSNDASIVYVRNDKLEIIFEVVRSPNHFAEEVHGFSHEAYGRGNLERMRARERDDQDE